MGDLLLQLVSAEGVGEVFVALLGAADVARLSAASKSLRAHLDSPKLWWALVQRDFGPPAPAAAALCPRHEYARLAVCARWLQQPLVPLAHAAAALGTCEVLPPGSVHTVRASSNRRILLDEQLPSQMRTLRLDSPMVSSASKSPPFSVSRSPMQGHNKENIKPRDPNILCEENGEESCFSPGRSRSTPEFRCPPVGFAPPRIGSRECLQVRLKQDLFHMMMSCDKDVSAFPDEPGDFSTWSGRVSCPRDGSLLGGTQYILKLHYDVSSDVSSLPRVCILRPVCFHPNVDLDGFISSAALACRASPCDSVRVVLQRVSELLCRPSFAVAPQNVEALAAWYGPREEYKRQSHAYEVHAWTHGEHPKPLLRTICSETSAHL